MNKLILLGAGLELSPSTQHALGLASELLEHSSEARCAIAMIDGKTSGYLQQQLSKVAPLLTESPVIGIYEVSIKV